MISAVERVPRMLALVPYLRSHPGTTLANAAQVFGVTEDDIVADVGLLNHWCCLPGGAGGAYIDIGLIGDELHVAEPQMLDAPMRLTADEATALLVAARALADIPGLADRDVLERAIEKVESAILPGAARPHVDVVAVPHGQPAVMESVKHALDFHRALRIDHVTAARDELSTRVIDPVRLELHDGHAYLHAWCRRAGAMRSFRVDRIRSAELLDEPANPPAQELLTRLPAATPGSFTMEGNERVVVDLAASRRWLADSLRWDSATERSDGGLRLVLYVASRSWLTTVILSAGGLATVAEPADLAAEVRALAAEALGAYA